MSTGSDRGELPHDVLDRAQGVMLGMAVGDALGVTLEFLPRDVHPRHTEMTGGGLFNLRPGEWSNDTSLGLALADSLVRRDQFDAVDVMESFLRWYRTGAYSPAGRCVDIGITTRWALEDFERTCIPYAGRAHKLTAGNGSLMRIGPVALFALHNETAADRIAADQSRLTHATAAAVESCQLMVQLLRAATLGHSDILELSRRLGREYPTLKNLTARTWRKIRRDRIRSGGFVLDTLAASLWSVAQTSNVEDAVTLAVNLGEDADTVGAVTGQLAGAIYGASRIPERWLSKLAWCDEIRSCANSLMRFGERN